jgi:ribonuclease HII
VVGAPTGGRLGLDEAGRGCVLGPIVVGAFLSQEATDEELRSLGVRDSKLLSPKAREDVYQALRTRGRILAYRAEPALIDRYVSQGRYNELELEIMGRLVSRLAPSEVYVDACDPDAERFGRRLHDLAAHRGWRGRVVSRHKADRDLPIVGAASIVAKVTRDRALARLQARTLPRLGSGYPADPLTREFLRRALADGQALPAFVRRSWATVDKLKSRPKPRPLESFP